MTTYTTLPAEGDGRRDNKAEPGAATQSALHAYLSTIHMPQHSCCPPGLNHTGESCRSPPTNNRQTVASVQSAGVTHSNKGQSSHQQSTSHPPQTTTLLFISSRQHLSARDFYRHLTGTFTGPQGVTGSDKAPIKVESPRRVLVTLICNE